jgi:hypothetical protein
MTDAELDGLRADVERWNPRCAFTYVTDHRATQALVECGTVRGNHDEQLDGHPFVERPSDRLTIRRLLATLDQAVPTVIDLAEALHDAMCDISHHDRQPHGARCSKWARYPNIAHSVVEHLTRRLDRG